MPNDDTFVSIILFDFCCCFSLSAPLQCYQCFFFSVSHWFCWFSHLADLNREKPFSNSLNSKAILICKSSLFRPLYSSALVILYSILLETTIEQVANMGNNMDSNQVCPHFSFFCSFPFNMCCIKDILQSKIRSVAIFNVHCFQEDMIWQKRTKNSIVNYFDAIVCKPPLVMYSIYFFFIRLRLFSFARSLFPILSLCCQKDSVNILSTLHNTCDSIHLPLAYTWKAHNQLWKAAALNGFEASLHAALCCHHRLSHIQRMHCRHPSNRCVYVCLCVFLGLYGLCHVCLWRKKKHVCTDNISSSTLRCRFFF